MLKFGKIYEKIIKSCPKVAKISQKWPSKAKASKSGQRMPKNSHKIAEIRTKKLPVDAKGCQNMQIVDKIGT